MILKGIAVVRRWAAPNTTDASETYLQALLCTMGLLDSNPDLKTDTTMGVVVGEYKILYEPFNDKDAAGRD